MLLTTFSVLTATASAEIVEPEEVSSAPPPAAPTERIYGPGAMDAALSADMRELSYLPTFQRWDGAWRPVAALNLSAGEWPYAVNETETAFHISRLGETFSQAKIPSAIYEFRPEAIKETIVLDSIPAVPAIEIAFSTSYAVDVRGDRIALRNAAGDAVWTTEPFVAWDSAETPRAWLAPFASVAYAGGQLLLVASSEMLANATYPLYIDPTWTLSATAGWAASTFQDAVEDKGDHAIKIGWLADNFDDNTNEIWTVEFGSASWTGGAMRLGVSTAVRSGSAWSDQRLGFTVTFTGSGSLTAYFRYSDGNNNYRLLVHEANDFVALDKTVGGTPTQITSFTQVINLNFPYRVKVVGAGNYFEVWWDGQLKWSGTDPSPPASPVSGPIRFGTCCATGAVDLDNFRVWNTAMGTMTTSVRDAGTTNRPLDTKILGAVDAHGQIHVRIRSSPDNVTWGPWTNLKADMALGVAHKVPDQDRLRYYQLRVVLTSGTDSSPALAELTTTEGSPTTSPVATTGIEGWHPYVGGLVNAVSGNLWYSTQDIAVQGRGFSLAIVRSYNSLRSSEAGPFGNGWTFNYGQKIVVNADRTVTWNDGDGSQHTFQPKEVQRSPTAHSGSWTNGQNAFASDNVYATTTTSNALHTYSAYGFAAPPDLALTKVEVCVEAHSAGDDDLAVKISTNAGATWSGEQILNLPGADPGALSCLDFTSYMGTWSWSDVSDANFRVQVRYVKVGGKASTNSIDWIPVRLTTSGYGSPRGVPSRLVKNADGTFALWQPDSSRIAFASTGRLTSVTDRNGNKVTLTYDANGRLTNVADDSGKSLAFTYDAAGRIIRVTDPMNRQINYTYDGSGNLASAADAMNQLETYTYASGKLSAIIDPIGKRTSFVYDASNRVTEVWLGFYQGGAVVWQFRTYRIAYTSTTGRTVTNARGFDTTLTLNSFGNPTDVSGPAIGCGACDPRGNSTSFVWDGEMNRIRVTDGRGNAWVMDHDPRSALASRTDPGGNVSSSTWLEVNNATLYLVLVSSQTNFRGYTTTYAYDGRGNLIRVTDAKGNIAEAFYDAFGLLNRSRDPRGFDTWYEYNANGYLIKVTDPLNLKTQYGYDVVGRPTTATSPGGHLTTTTYDSDDRVTKVTDPLGNFTTYEYNARGDRTRVVDPMAYATTHTINVTNHRVQVVTDALGNSTTYSYDLRGNLAAVTNAMNRVTSYAYEAYDRLVNVTSPLGFSSTHAYDAAGNRIRRTDPNGNTTTYAFDQLNRLGSVRYPNGTTIAYTYDKNGNLLSESGLGYSNTMTYDELDRATSVTTNHGSFPTTMTYFYDTMGNRIGTRPSGDAFRSIVLRPNGNGGTIQWFPAGCTANYDCVDEATADNDATRVASATPGQIDLYQIANVPAGTTIIRSVRVTAVARVPTPCEDISCWGDLRLRVNGFESPAFSVEAGSLYGALSYTWATNPSTGKAWTEAEVNALQAGMKLEATNWIVRVTQVYVTVEVEPFLMSYDAANRPTQTVDPEGRVTAYTYDADSRQTSVKYPNNVGTNTTYDDVGRTASVYTNKSGSVVIESFAYTYDKAGNRLTMKDATATTSYEYDKLHRLVKEVTPSGFSTTYKYGKVGNRVEKTAGSLTTFYYHDADDRLIREEVPSLGFTLLYEYDKNGNLVRDWDELSNPGYYTYDHENRLTRLHYPNSGYTCSWTYFPNGARASSSCSPTTYYAYDFFGGGGYEDVVAEYDSAGTRQARYTRGPGADEPVGMLQGGAYYAYHTDALGSVTRLTDAGQSSAATYRYDGWGVTTTESGTVANPFRFTGREKLPGSVLYHYRARTYDPDVGRFLSKDPSGMADGPNLYAYVGSNPVNRIDPSGMKGRGPTCPPGKEGQGNAYGHCGGGSDGATSPGVGPGSSLCTARWIYLGITVAVAIASLILGYAAYTVATQSLPFLVATTGIGVTGQLAGLVTAFTLGDTGKVLQVLWTVFGYILGIALAGAGFWTILGIMGRVVSIWALVIQLIIAAAFIGFAIYQLMEAKCI